MPGDPAEDNRGCFDTGERDRYPAISDAGGGGDSGQPKCVAARVLGQPKSQAKSRISVRRVWEKGEKQLCIATCQQHTPLLGVGLGHGGFR
jgi:hypothetical protein